MANESVVEARVNIPGWYELLKDGNDIKTQAEASERQHAAANILDAIVPGIAAIGMLLWHAQRGVKDDDGSQTARAGVLLESLAELVELLNNQEVNATRFELNLAHGYNKWGERRVVEARA
jgi:hypothetical protein